MQQEDLELFQIGQIMRRLKATRRMINHAIETLGLEPHRWRGGARLFNEGQVDKIGAKLERNSRGRSGG